jgi:hypothetical protein
MAEESATSLAIILVLYVMLRKSEFPLISPSVVLAAEPSLFQLLVQSEAPA